MMIVSCRNRDLITIHDSQYVFDEKHVLEEGGRGKIIAENIDNDDIMISASKNLNLHVKFMRMDFNSGINRIWNQK
jgi:hypothetical protein